MTNDLEDGWRLEALDPTDIPVGPCAWRLPMLAGEHAEYVAARPSLVVVDADDNEEVLRKAAPRLSGLPVMLHVREPAFARRLSETIERRLEALGRPRIEVLTLWVEDVADLKGGAMLQTLRGMREKGMVSYLGLGHHDVRNVEWLALHTPARVLVMPFSLDEQDAHYRAIAAAREYGMACVAAAAPSNLESIRFALGAGAFVLPVLDAPIPRGLTAMSHEEVERVWEAYREGHVEPASLPRGQPPE